MINLDSWVSRLKDAFSGIGTDEEEVTRVLNEAQGQMSTLVGSYPDLEDELYDEFSGDELKKALRLFYEVSPSTSSSTDISDPSWVSRLYESFNAGLFGGTDEDAVYDVLQKAFDEGQINALAQPYARQYPGELSLEDELYYELSGDELKKALRLYYKGPIKRLSIDGTLVPYDPNVPFVPRFPIVINGPVWIHIGLSPDLAEQSALTLHLFTSSGNYDQKKKISEFASKKEDSVFVLFDDAPTDDASMFTIEILAEDGSAMPIVKNVVYRMLQIA